LVKHNLAAIENEISALPAPVIDEYKRSLNLFGESLEEQDKIAWAQEGLKIAQQAIRAWEAATEYFRASFEIYQIVPFPQFLIWARNGSNLSKESPSIGVSYFRSSPMSIPLIKHRNIETWASMGQNLYNGTWKSTTLASKFFESSPVFLQNLTIYELEMFVNVIATLAQKSYDLATECILLGQRSLPQLHSDREQFIKMLNSLADQNWREVKGCLEAIPRLPKQLNGKQRDHLFSFADRLAASGSNNVSQFLIEASQSLGLLNPEHQDRVFALAELLIVESIDSIPPFIKNTPIVLSKITIAQLEDWLQEGITTLKQNPEGGLSYFRIESSRSESVIESLSSILNLSSVQHIIELYSQALSGSDVQVESTAELASKGIGWAEERQPTTEGKTIYLPGNINRYHEKYKNFAWYKVLTTHQVSHLEFGSFNFDFEKDSILFENLRPTFSDTYRILTSENAESSQISNIESHSSPEDSIETSWITDMQRFFDLFHHRKLALDIFTAVEDGRLDHLVKVRYPGIRAPYRDVQEEALLERPPIEQMPLQQALIEILLRLSLDSGRVIPVPVMYTEEARVLGAIVQKVFNSDSTVEDSSEATIRIYQVISLMPNNQIPEEDWENQNLEGAEYTEEELQQLVSDLQNQSEGDSEPANEEYDSPQQVDYRGEFKPELGQLLSTLKDQDGASSEDATQQLSKEQIEEMLSKSVELQQPDQETGQMDPVGSFAENIMKEAGLDPAPDTPGQGQGRLSHHEEKGGPLFTKEPDTYVYDEWDFRADDYKPRWCIVREKMAGEGDAQFYSESLRNYSQMMLKIRRQFESLMPEMFRKVKRLEDGEDIDLDALIEAIIDRKAGQDPSNRIYWARNKVQRDVSVVFLLDMSASTAEAIDESKRAAEWDAPDDPVEYMIWLRSRRGEGGRRNYKRIIDIEKESMVLLTNALEVIGDTYGIYGFSGYGRENVEFYVIKDLKEQFGEQVKKRIDKIAPLHATRMGPAIRHAVSKLKTVDSRTKILFLISDGRPQDRGYSREGVEKEYAVHDTRMALLEARRESIVPFALTVDKAGHDYLKTMCQDMAYEVLEDISQLPQRLPYLYRRLTV